VDYAKIVEPMALALVQAGARVVILAPQNGLLYDSLEKLEVLKQNIIKTRLIVNFGVVHIAGGYAVKGVAAESIIAPVANPDIADVLRQFSKQLSDFQLPCFYEEDAQRALAAIWKKAIFNSAVNSICAITGIHRMGDLLRSKPAVRTSYRVLEEGIEVANRHGVTFFNDNLIEGLHRFIGGAPSHTPSMIVDYQLSRQTEIDFLNGAIFQMGEKKGVACPVNRRIWKLVQTQAKLPPTALERAVLITTGAAA
jgi:2-dehydropantoate 2-reductase